MTRLALKQLAQTSATHGQMIRWNNTTGEYEIASRLFDAVVPDDYTLPSAAFAAGASSVFVRSGTYVETANVVIPNGGRLSGQITGTIIDLSGGFTVTVDGSARRIDTGTIAFTNGLTAVVGTGTTFTTLNAGDFIAIGAVFFEIATITDATNLDLVETWEGRTRSTFPLLGTSMFSEVIIEDICFLGATATGLNINAVRNGVFRNLVVLSCLDNILLNDCGSLAFDTCRSAYSGVDGVNVLTSRTIRFDQCHFENNVQIGADVQTGSLAVKFTGCEFDGNGVDGCQVGGNATDVQLVACGSKNNAAKGVDITAGTARVIVVGGTIEFNGGVGVDLSGAQCTLTGAQIGNNGGDGVVSGNENTIAGNRIHDNVGDGIAMAGDTNVTVSGNTIDTNGSDGISVTGGGGSDNSFIGNQIFDNTGTGLNIVAGSDMVVSGNKVANNTAAQIVDSGTDTVFALESSRARLNASHQLTGLQTATFEAEFDNGSQGASWTLDWNNGQMQRVTLTASTTTLTITAPPSVGRFMLVIVQGGAGNFDITWPASLRWPNGTPPNLTNAAGSIDIVTFAYDGTVYYGVDTSDFQA